MVSRMNGIAAGIVALLGAVALATPAAAAQQKPGTAAGQGSATEVTGYHLVLLVADDKAGAAVEGVTPAVTKALKDVQQFLPFKSYRVLDSTLIRGQRGGETRVSGLNGRVYNAFVQAASLPPGVAIRELLLRETYATSSGEEKSRNLLSSTFNMAPGETVVAGTSRLTSGEALVVVLTALTGSELR